MTADSPREGPGGGLFEGRVAVVTGATRGIGRACVEVLLREGATVVGCARTDPGAADLGPKYTHKDVDVADHAALEAFITWVDAQFGRIDVVVNNAGSHPPMQSIDDVSVESFQDTLNLNLTSMFVVCRAALPSLRRVRGSIVNMGSAVGLFGQEGAAAYCASKGAISGLTKSLAIDEAIHGVRVNCVCPAAIQTSMTTSTSKEVVDLVGSYSWLDRWGQPQEVAELVAFVASDRASFITGQDLLVGGGAELGYGLKAHNYFAAREALGRGR